MTEIREKLNIKYFKGSFITTPPTKEFIGEYFTQKKNIKIGVFEKFARVKVTLMGRKNNFVNITGAKSFDEMERFQTFYCDFSKQKIIREIKIDSISANYKITNMRQLYLSEYEEKLSESNLFIKHNSHFPGSVIRYKGSQKGECAIIFPSSFLNFIGFKKIWDIYIMLDHIKEIFFTKNDHLT